MNPGWARYDTLTYCPGVRAGNTLYMSGFAALDMETQQATHAGDLRAQAEATYDAIAETLAAVGRRPGRPAHDGRVRDARRAAATTASWPTCAARCSRAPYPASTGVVCGGLLRDEFLLEVVPTAVIPPAAGDE